jgi:hypothetical protein
MLSSIHAPLSAPAQSALERFEAELRHRLPAEYRNFLLGIGGGRVHHPYVDPISELGVGSFFGLGTPEEGLDLRTNRTLTQDWIPSELLPIAGDSFGNLLCIGIAGDEAGKLFFCDHEGDVFGGSMTLSLVAESFDEFTERTTIQGEFAGLNLEECGELVATALRAIYNDSVLQLVQPFVQGLDADAKAANGESLMHYAAFGCRLTCLEVLIERGANLNVENDRGATPLFDSLYCLRSLRMLVGHGANMEHLDKAGTGLLQRAAEGQYTPAIYELVKLGAEWKAPRTNGKTVAPIIDEAYYGTHFWEKGKRLIDWLQAQR